MMLQFISHFTDKLSCLDSIRMALMGGCRWIQLRMKNATTRELYETALKVVPLCREAGATIIIDDRLDVALAAKADGVHLGQKDLPIDKAREIVGPDFIIGGTANTFEQVKAHAIAGANYVGCGPFRFTTTKQGLAPVLGLDGYRRLVERMKEEVINLPVVAIGGITNEDIPQLMQTGVTGIALSGSVLRAADPAEEMRKIINTYKQEWTN